MTTASIVINTYGRARSLERLLPSLRRLHGVPFEVIVVDGPSTDDTRQVIAAAGADIAVHRCAVPNLSTSRNIGIAAAVGDVVVFIDDDALPCDAGWLRRLVDAFDADAGGRLGAAGGPALHADTAWTEFAGGWTSDYAEQRFHDAMAATDCDSGRWYRRTVGNNSAFRRSALEAIGGFDEHFAYYLDEADVCLRLARAGYEVRYLPDCPVRHYPAVSPHGAPFIRNRRLIARSDTYYCLKNGADPWPRRLVETLRRAPGKHFVRELDDLVAQGRLDRAEARRLRRQWARGLVEGLTAGLLSSRRTPLRATGTRPIAPFATLGHERPSICLLSRHLPPDPHAGGVGRYTWDLACGLHELGHDVTIVTEGDGTTRQERLGFRVATVQPAPLHGGLVQTPILAHNLAYAEAVAARVSELEREHGRFLAIHASNWGLEALGVAHTSPSRLVLMLVTPLDSVMAAEGWSPNLDLIANITLDQWLIGRARSVCTPSHGVLDGYRRRRQWVEPTTHVVPLGIVCRPRATHQPGAVKRLLFVGRLERRKGIDLLLDVLPGLLTRHTDWQCDIVGNATIPDGPGRTPRSSFLERHAGAAWLDRVTFHGAVDDATLQACYARADLFVAPSRFESFGLIYQEAMQHGVPVVACRVGGVPEVVVDGEHGRLVPPGDADALARALGELMADETGRRRLGAAAAAAVRDGGSHLDMARRMSAEYARVHARERRDDPTSDRGPGGILEAVVAILDEHEETRGVGLAFRATAAYEHGDRGEAARLMAEALGLAPRADFFMMAIDMALTDGDLAAAADLAARALAVTEDQVEARAVCAVVLERAGAPVEPGRAWPPATEPDRRQMLFAAAVAAIRSGKDGTATLLLEHLVADTGTTPAMLAQARYHLGSTWKRRGRRDEAHAAFTAMIASGDLRRLPEPLRAALHFHLGELDLARQDPVAARRHFAACLALNPGHGKARAQLDALAQEGT